VIRGADRRAIGSCSTPPHSEEVVSEPHALVYEEIDHAHADQPAATRRTVVAGGAAHAGQPRAAVARGRHDGPQRHTQTILNIAATAEVLPTIVNTGRRQHRSTSTPVDAERVDLAERAMSCPTLTQLGAGD
jgi:hypothetical protein